jgi:hypothetical protein
MVVTSFREGCVLAIDPLVTKSSRVLWLSFWAEVHYNRRALELCVTPIDAAMMRVSTYASVRTTGSHEGVYPALGDWPTGLWRHVLQYVHDSWLVVRTSAMVIAQQAR